MKRILLIATVMSFGVAVPFVLFGGEPEPTPAAAPEAGAEVTDTTDTEVKATDTGTETVGETVVALPTVFQHDVETYSVVVTSGGEGGLQLKVVPKTGFHVNTMYPWKYKATDKTYAKDDFQLTEEQALLGLVAGEDGELRFSVCNDQTCLIEKVAVRTAESD